MENLTPRRVFRIALTRPWIMLIDPLCLWTTIYMSFIYMLEYMLFSIYPEIFQKKRHWNSGVGELPFLGMVLGSCVAATIIFVETAIMEKRKKHGKSKGYRPEGRMRIGMIGAVTFAAGICEYTPSICHTLRLEPDRHPQIGSPGQASTPQFTGLCPPSQVSSSPPP